MSQKGRCLERAAMSPLMVANATRTVDVFIVSLDPNLNVCEIPYGGIAAPLVSKFGWGVSELVGKLRS